MVMSAFLSGSADSVFIHSAGSPNSSYLDILLGDKSLEVSPITISRPSSVCQLKDKLFISEINLDHDDELEKMTFHEATSVGLMGIASFGGFFVQVKSLNFLILKLKPNCSLTLCSLETSLIC